MTSILCILHSQDTLHACGYAVKTQGTLPANLCTFETCCMQCCPYLTVQAQANASINLSDSCKQGNVAFCFSCAQGLGQLQAFAAAHPQGKPALQVDWECS